MFTLSLYTHVTLECAGADTPRARAFCSCNVQKWYLVQSWKFWFVKRPTDFCILHTIKRLDISLARRAKAGVCCWMLIIYQFLWLKVFMNKSPGQTFAFFLGLYSFLAALFAVHLAVFLSVTPQPGKDVEPTNFGRYAYHNYPNAKIGHFLSLVYILFH